jgi:hypothetical protein
MGGVPTGGRPTAASRRHLQRLEIQGEIDIRLTIRRDPARGPDATGSNVTNVQTRVASIWGGGDMIIDAVETK